MRNYVKKSKRCPFCGDHFDSSKMNNHVLIDCPNREYYPPEKKKKPKKKPKKVIKVVCPDCGRAVDLDQMIQHENTHRRHVQNKKIISVGASQKNVRQPTSKKSSIEKVNQPDDYRICAYCRKPIKKIQMRHHKLRCSQRPLTDLAVKGDNLTKPSALNNEWKPSTTERYIVKMCINCGRPAIPGSQSCYYCNDQ